MIKPTLFTENGFPLIDVSPILTPTAVPTSPPLHLRVTVTRTAANTFGNIRLGFQQNVSSPLMWTKFLPYDCSAQQLAYALNSLTSEVEVEVLENFLLKSSTANRIWTVSFKKPLGNIIPLKVDLKSVYGAPITANVTTLVDGNTHSLWFSPLPAYSLEVPLHLNDLACGSFDSSRNFG